MWLKPDMHVTKNVWMPHHHSFPLFWIPRNLWLLQHRSTLLKEQIIIIREPQPVQFAQNFQFIGKILYIHTFSRYWDLTWLTRKTRCERQSLKNKHWDNEHTFTKLFRVARKLRNGIKILCHHDKCFFPWKKQKQSRLTMYTCMTNFTTHNPHTPKKKHRNSFYLGAAWFNLKPNLCQACFNSWHLVSLLLVFSQWF